MGQRRSNSFMLIGKENLHPKFKPYILNKSREISYLTDIKTYGLTELRVTEYIHFQIEERERDMSQKKKE